jgi:hypothetical protein
MMPEQQAVDLDELVGDERLRQRGHYAVADTSVRVARPAGIFGIGECR